MAGVEDFLRGQAALGYADIAVRVRHMLGDNPWQDALALPYAIGDGVLTLISSDISWEMGDIAEIDDGTGSLFRVSATPVVAGTVDVQPAFRSSPDVAHEQFEVILKNPRFPFIEIYDAIVASLGADATPSHVWYVATTSITIPDPAVTNIYPLPGNFVELIQNGVVQQTTSSVTDTYTYPKGSYEVLRNQPVSICPDGVGLRLLGSSPNLTNPLYINYKAMLTTSVIPDGDYAELIVNGACARLMGALEIREGFTMKQRPSGGADRATAAWFRLRKQEVRQVIRAKLRDLAPPERNYVSSRAPRGNW